MTIASVGRNGWQSGHQTDVKYLVIPLNSCQSQALTKSDTPESDRLCCLLIFTEASQQEAWWDSLPGKPRLLQPDKSKNKQPWKVGAPFSLGGPRGLTGGLDTMELSSNLYQFPSGSDQLVFPISLQQLEKHTEGSVFWRAGQSLVMLFFPPPSSLQWDYNGPCCLPLFRHSLIDNNTLGDVTVLAPSIVIAWSARGALGPLSPPFFQVL